jgi:acyl carrier protein
MILDAIRDFVIREYLPGQAPATLGADVPLISSGVIDSVGTLKLVLFLEETYGVQIDAADIDAGKLDSLASISALVDAKRSGTRAGE